MEVGVPIELSEESPSFHLREAVFFDVLKRSLNMVSFEMLTLFGIYPMFDIEASMHLMCQ